MIKLSQNLPEVFDPSNPDSMRQWMVAVKQCVEELARKSQSLQMEERTTAPSANDIEEGEFVRATIAGTDYIYTKQGGTIRYWALT